MTDNYAALLRQTAKLYRESLVAPDTNDMCTLAYQWQDKKHRHVWDLCKELEKAADYNEKIKAQLELEVDDLKICRSERLELYIRMEKLEAELHHCFHRVEELQAALREIIVHCEVPAPPNAEALKMFARKALEENND